MEYNSKYSNEEIINVIKNENDFNDYMYLSRLYEFYNNNKQFDVNDYFSFKDKTNKNELLKIKIAQNNIKNKINLLSVDELGDLALFKRIKNSYIILENYMKNLDVYDKKKDFLVIETITYLECVLGIPCTFVDYVENILEKEIEKRKQKRK